MVASMSAEEKLRAVQLWNVLSEKLQEIVNNSAADINALAFQEPPPSSGPEFFFYPPATKPPQPQDVSSAFTPPEASVHQPSSNKSPMRDNNIETDNSLASFSDIQCADDELIHMDGVCPLTLPVSLEERTSELSQQAADAPLNVDIKEKARHYECAECGATFRTKGHLSDHSRKHTGNNK